MNRSLLYLCIVFTSVGGLLAQNQPEKLKMPGPELQNLMLGTWRTEAQYERTSEMPNGGTALGTEIWRPGPGGFSVIEESREKNAKGDYEGLGVAWWDSKAQGQRFVWCDSNNPNGCYVSKEVAKWDGKSLVWKEEQENAGKKRMYSEVFRDITPTSFTQVLGEGESGEALKATVTIRATKVSETPISGTATFSDEALTLKQLTHEWIDAINTKDRAKLDRLMAPDFVLSGWDGSWQVERARWLDNLFHVIDIQDYSHSGISAQVYGDVAAVTSNWYWRGVRGTDEKKPFEERGYVVDVWRRDGKAWRVVSRKTVILPGKEETPK